MISYFIILITTTSTREIGLVLILISIIYKQKEKVSLGQKMYFFPYWNTAVPTEDPGPLSLLGWVSITKDANMLWSGSPMKSLIYFLLQVAAV